MFEHTLIVLRRCLIFVGKHYPIEVITLVTATFGLLYVFNHYQQSVGVEANMISSIHILPLDKGYRISKGQVQIIRRDRSDELLLSLEFVKSPDFKEPTSSFKVITDGPMVSSRVSSLNVEERDVWINDQGDQHRVYVLLNDKDEVHFLQTLKATFFDVFQGQMLLSLRITVGQEPPPPISAYFYPEKLLVSTISPEPTKRLPGGGKPRIIGFEDAVSKPPNFDAIEMVGSDVAKQRTIQGDSFRFGILAGVFTSLFAGAVFEILRTTLKLVEKKSGSEVERT
jgi:hypothetical protein